MSFRETFQCSCINLIFNDFLSGIPTPETFLRLWKYRKNVLSLYKNEKVNIKYSVYLIPKSFLLNYFRSMNRNHNDYLDVIP